MRSSNFLISIASFDGIGMRPVESYRPTRAGSGRPVESATVRSSQPYAAGAGVVKLRSTRTSQIVSGGGGLPMESALDCTTTIRSVP